MLPLPDIRLVYWAGGNPFHHHQDLFGLQRAFSRPDTIIVNEPFWTATARHADIVFPVTMSLERDDIGAGRNDGYIIAMPRALEPYGQARDDYEILAGLASRLGIGDEFTEGRDAFEWVEHLYGEFERRCASAGIDVAEFSKFWLDGETRMPATTEHHTMFSEFRADPGTASAVDAERSHRAVLRDHRRLRLRRLSGPSDLARTGGAARRSGC